MPHKTDRQNTALGDPFDLTGTYKTERPLGATSGIFGNISALGRIADALERIANALETPKVRLTVVDGKLYRINEESVGLEPLSADAAVLQGWRAGRE